MSQTTDAWYIRFPDGRVVRATSTLVVRQQLHGGRIPPGSTVRRYPEEEWTALEWTQEFADLFEAPIAPAVRSPRIAAPKRESAPMEPMSVAARMDGRRLRTLGVAGVLQELVAALDSTLVRKKLFLAVLAGLCLGVVLALARLPALPADAAGQPWLGAALTGAAVLVVVALITALLSQLTYVELCRLRPARWREGFTGLGGLTVRLALAQLLVAGGVLVVIGLLDWLPGWLLAKGPGDEPMREFLARTAAVAVQVAAVGLWPFFILALLLGPVLVVEECSVFSALRQWFGLLRAYPWQVFLYEALALGLGAVVTVPLVLPLLVLPAFDAGLDGRLTAATAFTRQVLTGLALAPLLAYLVVANVFIYLNLRYEYGDRR
jgi:hypothetical protein